MTTQTVIAPDVRDVLERGHFKVDAYYLPDEQLERTLYDQVNKILAHFGGKWDRGSKSHLFPVGEMERLRAALESGDKLPPKNPDGYFETPPDVADYVATQLTLDPSEPLRLLEPSAGTGALCEAVLRRYPEATVEVCEINPERAAILEEKGYSVVRNDFLLFDAPPQPLYDAVVMNPPFSTPDDSLAYIAHLEHATDFVKPGGTVVCVCPAGILFREDGRTAEMREIVEQFGYALELPKDSFKESGTGVNAALVVLRRPAE